MRYALADGGSVVGYEPFSTILNTIVVSNDICCSKGCEGGEFSSLLGGCAERTEIQRDVNYLPIPPECEAVVTIDVNYFLSNGDLACEIENTVTYSTRYGDSFVVMEDCCAKAVSQLDFIFTEDELDIFCHKEEEITDNSEVEFDDTADGGAGVCTML